MAFVKSKERQVIDKYTYCRNTKLSQSMARDYDRPSLQVPVELWNDLVKLCDTLTDPSDYNPALTPEGMGLKLLRQITESMLVDTVPKRLTAEQVARFERDRLQRQKEVNAILAECRRNR